jgi:glycogen phosphorylase
VYAVGDAWARKGMLNLAGCGKFSSDHTIAQYAAEILASEAVSGAMKRIGA